MASMRVVDLETTGFHEGAEVLELGMVEIHEVSARSWRITGRPASFLFDVAGAISSGARAVHHISKRDVRGQPLWVDAGASCLGLRQIGVLWGNDLERLALGDIQESPIIAYVAHQAEYERRWIEPLAAGTPWLCTYKCALRAWPDAPGHGLFALLYWLEDEGKLPGLERAMTAEHKLAHRAAPDAWATAYLATYLLSLFELDELLQWTREPRHIQKVPFGEHRGKRWEEVDTGLLEWILKKDFDEDVMAAAKRELERRMAERDRRDAAPGPLFQDVPNA